MKKCAFLTMDSLEEFVAYDHLLVEPLAGRGWEVTEVSWRDGSAVWDAFEAVVIRSPWDYQDDPGRFMEVLEAIDRSSARLDNPLELVRWNIDKAYLRDLEEQGLPVVPTAWGGKEEPLDRQALAGCFDRFGSEEIVLKPTVSANADDTYRLTRDAAHEKFDELKAVFDRRPWMVQPFVRNVTKEGEFSLVYFGEEYSHALLKTPKAGDFRVQEEHGGRLKSVEPEPALRSAADAIVEAVEPTPLYSRVDMVRLGMGGGESYKFALMELELIEPSLYFNMDPGSPERFASVFDRWMGE